MDIDELDDSVEVFSVDWDGDGEPDVVLRIHHKLLALLGAIGAWVVTWWSLG